MKVNDEETRGKDWIRFLTLIDRLFDAIEILLTQRNGELRPR